MARPLQATPATARAERPRLDPALLSYRLLRPRRIGTADVPLIGEAYRVWSDVWSETFLELDGEAHVPSDQFTRQDEVGAIFYGYECVALSCFRWVDLTLPMSFGDSYFERWPESAREAAMRAGPQVCIGNQITVARPWRRVQGVSLAALVTAMCIERFFRSDADAILGTMRDDRGMDALTQALGAEPIGKAELHGVPVTLVAVYRGSQRQPLDARTEPLIQRLAVSLDGGVS
ncbi:MAG TPA: hypothetical protein VFX59_09345 [Polyangiales bacterium]|nr:hypothetical protein [Polyangiales bacterium]